MRALGEHDSRRVAAEAASERLAPLSAAERIEWALEYLPGNHVLSSSFGAQAAVSLHLATRVEPDIPVILIDTGYLFPETYRFVDELADRLALDLRVYRPALSAAWQEARHGRRWQQGEQGIDDYNRENKVEPMERALAELSAGTWIAGLRRQQAASRECLPVVSGDGERWKLHPIIDWSDRDVHRYLTRHRLPYHPLWQEGYVSIGDIHTTRPLHEVADAADTRFFGLKRECGLHEIDFGKTG
jgi:phosphoadenosine phosphosulfate reductase